MDHWQNTFFAQRSAITNVTSVTLESYCTNSRRSYVLEWANPVLLFSWVIKKITQIISLTDLKWKYCTCATVTLIKALRYNFIPQHSHDRLSGKWQVEKKWQFCDLFHENVELDSLLECILFMDKLFDCDTHFAQNDGAEPFFHILEYSSQNFSNVFILRSLLIPLFSMTASCFYTSKFQSDTCNWATEWYTEASFKKMAWYDIPTFLVPVTTCI